MKKSSINSIIKKLEKEKYKVAKSRDELREILDELEMRIQSWDSSCEAIDCAIQELSTLV